MVHPSEAAAPRRLLKRLRDLMAASGSGVLALRAVEFAIIQPPTSP